MNGCRRGLTSWVAVAALLIGSTGVANAQLKVTGCLTKSGKLKQVEFGENPRKDCKGNERLLMLPITEKTDELMEALSFLAGKDQELMDKDQQLMEKDVELMGQVGSLAAKDAELMGQLAAQQEEIDEIIENLEDVQTFPGDGYPSPDQFGLTGHGLPLSYTDNGDLTATDDNTLFMWEVKLAADGSDGGNCADGDQANRSVHCANNLYRWNSAPESPGSEPNGTLFTVFLDTLNNKCDGDETTQCTSDADCTGNGNGLCGHAGHRDWEISNVKRLQSIVDFGRRDPAIDPAFPGATTFRGSNYWSATTTQASLPTSALQVEFEDGNIVSAVKNAPGQAQARATRSGPVVTP